MNTEFNILIVGESKFDILPVIKELIDEYDNVYIKKTKDISNIKDINRQNWDVIIFDYKSIISGDFDIFGFLMNRCRNF